VTATPLYLDAGGAPLFAWLHEASDQGTQEKIGMLLCSPWGREEVSAHLTLRHWAGVLSQAGLPTMRFDYLGEGDSAGDPLADGGLEAWVASQRKVVTMCLA
jgi:hypothetical protein